MNYRKILPATIVAFLFIIGAFLLLAQVASADHSALEPDISSAMRGTCSGPSYEALGWQPTWLLVNTQTFTAYLPIISNVQCRVGHTIDDPVNDVPLAHVDIVQAKSWLEGSYLNVQFQLRNIPPTLPFNRPGIPKFEDGYCEWFEYLWGASIDIDNNRATGGGGMDIIIIAGNCPDEWDPQVSLPIQDVIVDVWVGRWDPSCNRGRGCFMKWKNGSITVDDTNDIMVLRGPVGAIAPNAPISFWAWDYNPGGNRVQDLSCF